MRTHTVQVTNVSLKATQHNIQDFFSSSGEIMNIELQRDGASQIGIVTFKEASGLEAALLLSGATIVDQPVSISPLEDDSATSVPREQNFSNVGANDNSSSPRPHQNQATDMISTIMARSVILSKDASAMAKEFDDNHHLTASATASIAKFDKKTGISGKLSAGSAVVNNQLKAVDEKYHVAEKTRLTLVAAEEALMKNRYIQSGATWVSDTFAKVQHAAAEVNQEANEKAAVMEAEEYRTGHRSGHNRVFSGEDNRSPHADNSSAPTYPPSEHAPVADAGSESTVQYPNLGYDHYMPLLSSELPATKPPTAQA